MMFLDEAAYLWRDCSAVPSHQQHLANGPVMKPMSAMEVWQVPAHLMMMMEE